MQRARGVTVDCNLCRPSTMQSVEHSLAPPGRPHPPLPINGVHLVGMDQPSCVGETKSVPVESVSYTHLTLPTN